MRENASNLRNACVITFFEPNGPRATGVESGSNRPNGEPVASQAGPGPAPLVPTRDSFDMDSLN